MVPRLDVVGGSTLEGYLVSPKTGDGGRWVRRIMGVVVLWGWGGRGYQKLANVWGTGGDQTVLPPFVSPSGKEV